MANNNDVVNGTDLVLMVDVSVAGDGTEWQQVAHATTHSIDLTRESRGVSSKSTGEWMLERYGKISWSASLDGLILLDSGIVNYEVLVDKMIAREVIKVISVYNDIDNGTPLEDSKDDYDPTGTTVAENPFKSGTPYYEGDAVILSVNKSAGEGENATFSMSLGGASALEKKTVANLI